MKKPAYANELARALARSDADILKRSLSDYYDWTRLSGSEREHHWPDGLDPWFESDDLDRSLALVALAMASTDEEDFLIGVACGLLESVLSHGPAIRGVPLAKDFLQRIIDEARRTPRFRWMLSAMWTTGMPQQEAQLIADAVGSASCETDPLPPRPCA